MGIRVQLSDLVSVRKGRLYLTEPVRHRQQQEAIMGSYSGESVRGTGSWLMV